MNREEFELRVRIAALDAAIKAAQPGSVPAQIIAFARHYELYLRPQDT